MRIIKSEAVSEAVKKLCMEANYNLPLDIEAALAKGKETDASPLGREILGKMVENSCIARKNSVPVCQDTGMALVFVKLGNEVLIEGDLLEDAINKGVAAGYTEGYLRCSVVSDPLERVNTNDNTPAVIHIEMIKGDEIHITLAPKGFGSENMSAMRMFTPSATTDDIVNFVIETADKAGSNPCPPIIVGVGIGGTADKANILSKKALLNPVGLENPKTLYADMEKAMLKGINDLGIGPQGLGGNTTALNVSIKEFPTHIAGLPVAVSIGCYVTRHAETII